MTCGAYHASAQSAFQLALDSIKDFPDDQEVGLEGFGWLLLVSAAMEAAADAIPTELRGELEDTRCVFDIEGEVSGDEEAVQSSEPGPTPTTLTGAWELDDQTDEITDIRVIGVSLGSSSYRPSGGYYEAKLAVVCVLPVRGTPVWQVIIDWDQPVAVGSKDPGGVTTRFGTGEAVTEDWDLETGEKHIKENTYAPDSRVLGREGLVSKLQETDRFVARVVTAVGETLTATWDVVGLTGALKPVLAVCGGEPGEAGLWELLEGTDTSTGTQRVAVRLLSSSYAPTGGNRRAALWVGCTLPVDSAPYLWVFIEWTQQVASAEPVKVTTPPRDGASRDS